VSIWCPKNRWKTPEECVRIERGTLELDPVCDKTRSNTTKDPRTSETTKEKTNPTANSQKAASKVKRIRKLSRNSHLQQFTGGHCTTLLE
jgi:hypothetical protein